MPSKGFRWYSRSRGCSSCWGLLQSSCVVRRIASVSGRRDEEKEAVPGLTGRVKGAEPLPVGWLGDEKKLFRKNCSSVHTYTSILLNKWWRGGYPEVFTGSISHCKAFDLEYKDGVVKLDEVAALLVACLGAAFPLLWSLSGFLRSWGDRQLFILRHWFQKTVDSNSLSLQNKPVQIGKVQVKSHTECNMQVLIWLWAFLCRMSYCRFTIEASAECQRRGRESVKIWWILLIFKIFFISAVFYFEIITWCFGFRKNIKKAFKTLTKKKKS